MKTRNKTIVPRNPYAVAASQKKAGKHEESIKTKRQQDKQKIRNAFQEEQIDVNTPKDGQNP